MQEYTFTLSKEGAMNDILTLCDFERTLYIDGKVVVDKDPDWPYPCEKDKARTEKLNLLMNKYTYGWYIATQSLEEQIKSVNDFKLYILSSIGKTFTFYQ